MAEERGCKIRGSKLVCSTRNFLANIGLKDTHPDDIEFASYDLGADEQIRDEEMRRYRNNLESCSEGFLTRSSPIKGISGVKFDWGNDKVEIDISSKDELLNSIRQAVNGDGMFYYESNKQMMEVAGSGSKNKTIESHFAWLREIPNIYGTSSPRRCVERD